MNTWRRIAVLVLAAALGSAALAGCGGKSGGPAGPTIPTGTIDDLFALLDQAVVAGAVVPTNLDTAATSLLYSLEVDGKRGATALFVQLTTASQTLLDAGEVTIAPVASGTVALGKHQLSVTGLLQTVYTTFITRPAGILLPFDGTTFHRFAVSGSGAVAAFTDSVKSVTAPAVASPAAGAVVDSLADLTVTWSNPGSDTTVYVICELRSNVDSTRFAAATIARDVDGSAVVPQARLLPLPPGPATLSVARYRLAPRLIAGRVTAIVCESATTRGVTMN